MIHWLVESAQDLQEKPEWFLDRHELEKYATFQHEKRRSEWLLGRWTAKRLVQAALLETNAHLVALDAIEIDNDADGAPYVTVNVEHFTLHLSISHSHEHALCALAPYAVGADLEFIDPRSSSFLRDFFTPHEVWQVERTAPEQQAIVANAIWSAKEAALKAVHKGLSVDTRAVEITLPAFTHAPEHWTKFEIDLRVPVAGQIQGNAVALRGWWHVLENFVLTIAANGNELPDTAPLFPESILLARRANISENGVLHEQGHGILHRRIAQATRHHTRHEQGN